MGKQGGVRRNKENIFVTKIHLIFFFFPCHPISPSINLLVLDAFNKYVQLTGCTKDKRPMIVGDDTPLIHLLSYSVDGEQGSDLLYTVITDIVSSLQETIFPSLF